MSEGHAPAEGSLGARSTERARSIFDPRLRPISIATLATFSLVAFEALAVVTILPAITADLGDVELYSWILNAFILTSTVAILLAGPLIDTLGVTRVFRFAVIVFATASAATVAASSVPILIAIRTVQGIGGGLLLAVGLAAVAIAYPRELRSRGYAANSVVWGIASLAGPGLAAGLATYLSWRAIFAVKAVAAILVAFLGWRRLPNPSLRAAKFPRIDAFGSALVFAFTAVSLLGLSSVSLGALVAVGVAAGLFILYWWHAGRASNPLLPRRFIAAPSGPMNLIGFISFAAIIGIEAYLPLYVVGGLGRSALTGGIVLVVLSAVWSAGSITASRLLDRLSETTVMICGFSLLLVGALTGLALYTTTTPLWVVCTIAVVQGLGIGSSANAAMTLLPSLARPDEIGRITSTFQYLRSLGQAYAVAASGAVIFLIVRLQVGHLEPVRHVLAGEEIRLGAATRDALAMGFRLAHAIPAAAAALGVATAIYLRQLRYADPFNKA